MKQYIELCIVCDDQDMADIAIAYLSDYPFESFDTEALESGVVLRAYILATEWEACNKEATAAITGYGSIQSINAIEDENWNIQWETDSFEPVLIDDLFLIRAPHHVATSCNIKEIIVSPSMSFGSGHHNTTRMMCRLISDNCPKGKVLDVGCGTGILSIAALHSGATSVDAIDIDPWSTESAIEAAKLNGYENDIEVILGTVELIEGRAYDMVVANINRNIILNDLGRYTAALNEEGRLLVSGFLHDDIAAITSAAAAHNLTPTTTLEEEGWVAIAFIKE